jgi:hypothetical protein
MKYTAVRCIHFCLAFFWASAGIAAAQEPQPNSAPVPATIAGATIAEWKGNVRLSLPGQVPSDPQRGEQLPPGTILDTGSGRLLLRLSDGSEVIVRAQTKLQVQEPSLTDPSYFQLLLGRIRAFINKRTGGALPFELGTPSAVIAVRGTRFDVEVNPRNITEVDVSDGIVEVYGRNASGGSVFVEPGFSTRVGMDSAPESPRPTEEFRPDIERRDEDKQSGERDDKPGDGQAENRRGDLDRGTMNDGAPVGGPEADPPAQQETQDNSPLPPGVSMRSNGEALYSTSGEAVWFSKVYPTRANASLARQRDGQLHAGKWRSVK